MSGDNSSAGSLMTDSTRSSDQRISPPPTRSIPAGSPAHVFRHTISEELPYTTSHRRNLYPHDSRRYLSCLGANGSREPPRAHSFQDLAILPTQRVMRYVLLFRGEGSLSDCTRVPVISSIVSRPPCRHLRNLLQSSGGRGSAGSSDENRRKVRWSPEECRIRKMRLMTRLLTR